MEDNQKKNISHKHVHSHLDCNGEEYTHDHEHGHSHSPEHKKAVFNRMSRIIGHMESTRRMVESERDCAEILIQLSAIEAAINSVSRVIIKEHLKTCIVDAVNHGDYDALDELNNAIDKFIK